jgi:hypothetical protein
MMSRQIVNGQSFADFRKLIDEMKHEDHWQAHLEYMSAAYKSPRSITHIQSVRYGKDIESFAVELAVRSPGWTHMLARKGYAKSDLKVEEIGMWLWGTNGCFGAYPDRIVRLDRPASPMQCA